MLKQFERNININMSRRIKAAALAALFVIISAMAGCTVNDSTEMTPPTGWIVEPEYGGIYLGQSMELSAGYSEGLLSVTLISPTTGMAKTGYVDESGEFAFDPDYGMANSFSNGLAVASQINNNTDFGYIDNTGAFVIYPQFKRAGRFSEDGLAAVQVGGNVWGYIDKSGQLAIPFQYFSASVFSDGIACVSAPNEDGEARYFYINTKGEKLFDKDFIMAAPFSDGIACVWSEVDDEVFAGYIDTDGEWVIEPSFQSAGSFNEGLAYAMDSESGRFGFIDKKGNWAIEPQYVYVSDFSEGRAVVAQYGENDSEQPLEGYINTKGELVTELKYCLAQPFRSGYAVATDREQYENGDQSVKTILDLDGNEYIAGEGLIEEGCSIVGYSYGDIAVVEKDGMYGVYRFDK